MSNCPYCGQTADNLKTHIKQSHAAMESYGIEGDFWADKNNYEVDTDEFIKTGEPVAKQPDDKRAHESEERMDCPHCGTDNFKLNQKCQSCYKPLHKAGEAYGYMVSSSRGRPVFTRDFEKAKKESHDRILRGHSESGVSDISEDDYNRHITEYGYKELGESKATELDHYEPKNEQSEQDWQKDLDDIKKQYQFKENWDFRTFNSKVESFEALGFTQGDALKMASLNWYDLSNEVQQALEVDDDEKETHRDKGIASYDRLGLTPKTEIDDLDDIDYNVINESYIKTKHYECEYCNDQFRSNESLAIHYNDIHAVNHFNLDGYEASTLGEGEYDVSMDSADDVKEAGGKMRQQVDYLKYTEDSEHGERGKKTGMPWQKGGESINDKWWWKYVEWKNGYDQDFLYCKQCHEDLLVPAYNNYGSFNDDAINKAAEDHFRQHGISNEAFKVGDDWCANCGYKFKDRHEECPNCKNKSNEYLKKKIKSNEFKPENQGKKIKLKDGSTGTIQSVGIFSDDIVTADGKHVKAGDYEIIGESISEQYDFQIEGNYAKCKTCGWVYSKEDGEDWKGLKEHQTDHFNHGDKYVRMVGESNQPHVYEATETVSYGEEYGREDALRDVQQNIGSPRFNALKSMIDGFNDAQRKEFVRRGLKAGSGSNGFTERETLKSLGFTDEDFRNASEVETGFIKPYYTDGWSGNDHSQDTKCGMCGKEFKTRQELDDHVFGLGPHNKMTVKEAQFSRKDVLKAQARNHWNTRLTPQDRMTVLRDVPASSFKTRDAQSQFDSLQYDIQDQVTAVLAGNNTISESYAMEGSPDNCQDCGQGKDSHVDIYGNPQSDHEFIPQKKNQHYESYATENWEDMELAGFNWDFTDSDEDTIRCKKCSKTFKVGTYPRRNKPMFDIIEREAQAHEDSHQPLNALINSDNSCKLCGQSDLSDPKRHLQSRHGITHTGESLANEDHWEEIEKEEGKMDQGQRMDWINNRLKQLHKQAKKDKAANEATTWYCDDCGQTIGDGKAAGKHKEETGHRNIGKNWKNRSYLGTDQPSESDYPTESYSGESLANEGGQFECVACGQAFDTEEEGNAHADTHDPIDFTVLRKVKGEAMYGYGSATGRMSPAEAWKQGNISTYEKPWNPVFQEFRGIQWNELPEDIQELFKSEMEYLTTGESKSNERNLQSYWGGWYDPEATKGKYKKMEPDEKYNKEIGDKLDSISTETGGNLWDESSVELRSTILSELGEDPQEYAWSHLSELPTHFKDEAEALANKYYNEG